MWDNPSLQVLVPSDIYAGLSWLTSKLFLITQNVSKVRRNMQEVNSVHPEMATLPKCSSDATEQVLVLQQSLSFHLSEAR